MGEKIAFENGRISEFQVLVTLTLTLDRVILHTVMHQSLTSTYIPNFIEIKKTFCGRTDVRTFETHFIRSTRRNLPTIHGDKMTNHRHRHTGLSQEKCKTQKISALINHNNGCTKYSTEYLQLTNSGRIKKKVVGDDTEAPTLQCA